MIQMKDYTGDTITLRPDGELLSLECECVGRECTDPALDPDGARKLAAHLNTWADTGSLSHLGLDTGESDKVGE